ncbi:MAG: hypothetical protein F4025_08870 [Synechococcus sp. SB0669_bin_7]|nr:hypothetical protein [Synechococcus sp. SB0675_bin_7]MYK86491.1 hypothetical protein [Synechococcus sp. SB0669_bin_7]
MAIVVLMILTSLMARPSFNVNVTHSQEPVPEIGKQGLKYAPGLARAYGWFACFFYNEDVSPITLLKIMKMLRKAPH